VLITSIDGLLLEKCGWDSLAQRDTAVEAHELAVDFLL
jgi:hypothetical protein